jgi:hypothetical protein
VAPVSCSSLFKREQRLLNDPRLFVRFRCRRGIQHAIDIQKDHLHQLRFPYRPSRNPHHP